eukprot:4403919-Pyramimonas_sp.AAC.1
MSAAEEPRHLGLRAGGMRPPGLGRLVDRSAQIVRAGRLLDRPPAAVAGGAPISFVRPCPPALIG